MLFLYLLPLIERKITKAQQSVCGVGASINNRFSHDRQCLLGHDALGNTLLKLALNH